MDTSKPGAPPWSSNLAPGAQPLMGVRVLTLATNLPGPLAALRLLGLGAMVTKIEPPGGDMLAHAVPAWYADLHRGVEVLKIDLKTPAGQAEIDRQLARADLLITAQRPAALARLGLDWPGLHERHPNLCQVAIVGYPPPDTEVAGHDLTYQAAYSLLQPPALPRALIADFAGAEHALSAALALLFARLRGRGGGFAQVALSDAAQLFSAPVKYGATTPGGWLGGGHPGYGLYCAGDGWIAVAALEPHFERRLAAALDLPELSRADLEKIFPSRTVAEWLAWAAEHDLPISPVTMDEGRRTKDESTKDTESAIT